MVRCPVLTDPESALTGAFDSAAQAFPKAVGLTSGGSPAALVHISTPAWDLSISSQVDWATKKIASSARTVRQRLTRRPSLA